MQDCWMHELKGCTIDWQRQKCMGHYDACLPFLFYSTPFYPWSHAMIKLPYFPAHKMHRDFSLGILEKNDECILILVIYWKKTGLLHTKINNHNIIYSSQKPRKSSSLPLKSSSWCFHCLTIKMLYNRCTSIYKFGNNTYPRRIRRRSNLGHIFFRKNKCVLF